MSKFTTFDDFSFLADLDANSFHNIAEESEPDGHDDQTQDRFSPQLVPSVNLADSLQHLETTQFSFPDEAAIELPVLQTLRAGLNIARMLGVDQNIWNPAYRSLFVREGIRSSVIPENLVPVAIQFSTPHHPLFDILPWPSVRTKLITVFSMPLAARPPVARDALAILNMIYDIDDATEGIRVEGGNGMDGKHWEVGQAFFRSWWWALDRSVITQSNRLRRSRGAAPLKMPES